MKNVVRSLGILVLASSFLIVPTQAADAVAKGKDSIVRPQKNIFEGNWRYGDTLVVAYDTFFPNGWISIEKEPHRGTQRGYEVAKYINGANYGQVERSLSFNIPSGWVEIGRGYNSKRQAYIDIRNENKKRYQPHELENKWVSTGQPVPYGWVVVNLNLFEKHIVNITSIPTESSIEAIKHPSPSFAYEIPRGWEITVDGANSRILTRKY
ncbi:MULTISPECIES: hypothetical protein [Brevibacillus]|uniref:hypothetical protein n=1 Tax=Brevibacillus TaxID=55080 RepID=UPI000D102F25|nr:MULTISPECIES: hypothetical protein [Brevibacillus]PSJ68055.1 hypothetical protein C7J99_16685 [Brevibacillus brevis]RED35529.1 hypothetical protein DES34_101186 [Brevibacillus brevis]TQK63848.1 hypothetical protein FB479_103718 [Brevibacillus sp. AG162]VEF89360.1 Uncharacterised protein [Brevibacillus brevis]GEC87803.1 hypothetical protein BBR01nite_01340 [Brevibacillus brevis]